MKTKFNSLLFTLLVAALVVSCSSEEEIDKLQPSDLNQNRHGIVSLSQVNVGIENVNGLATGQVIVEVWDEDGNVIGSKAVDASEFPQSVALDGQTAISFGYSPPLLYQSGKKYRIAVRRTDPNTPTNRLVWACNHPVSDPNPYPHGDSQSPFPTKLDFNFTSYFNESTDQVNDVIGYGYSIQDINWYTQEFVVEMK